MILLDFTVQNDVFLTYMILTATNVPPADNCLWYSVLFLECIYALFPLNFGFAGSDFRLWLNMIDYAFSTSYFNFQHVLVKMLHVTGNTQPINQYEVLVFFIVLLNKKIKLIMVDTL